MSDIVTTPALSVFEMQQRLATIDYSKVGAATSSDEREAPRAASTDDRSKNALRPETFDEVIGQPAAVSTMRKFIAASKANQEPLDHTLLIGAAGTGKSTFSHVIAHELGVDVYEVEAPVDRETLLELREVMKDRDILRIEEIHQQAIMERRGKSAGSQPEVLYAIMEDRVMPSGAGLLDFPAITILGTTTDEGLLPQSFIDRFPIEPRLEPYDEEALTKMARWNGDKLGVVVIPSAAKIFAHAARNTPRLVNNYVKNAAKLCTDKCVDIDSAREALEVNGTTEDGLSVDMQRMLTFLYTKGKHVTKAGVVYRASVNTIATGIGKSRDSKAISLRVEPYLIEQGYIQIGQGRILTEAGIKRAEGLL